MRKRFLLSIAVLVIPLIAASQSREMGVMLGVAGYKGDLNTKMFNTEVMRPGVGILYRRCYSNHWSFRTGLSYMQVEGNDALAEDTFRLNRNLMFRSGILEFHMGYEFNFFPYQTANPASSFTPFVFGGIAVYYFNPKAQLNDTWYALQPLGTEGQGVVEGKKRYKRTSISLPFGGGVKMKISRRFGLQLEAGVRRTYTDYLDDVSTTYADPQLIRREFGKVAAALSDRSFERPANGNLGRQRGNSTDNDWYYFAGVQLNYTLSKKYIDHCSPFKIKLR